MSRRNLFFLGIYQIALMVAVPRMVDRLDLPFWQWLAVVFTIAMALSLPVLVSVERFGKKKLRPAMKNGGLYPKDRAIMMSVIAVGAVLAPLVTGMTEAFIASEMPLLLEPALTFLSCMFVGLTLGGYMALHLRPDQGITLRGLLLILAVVIGIFLAPFAWAP